MTPFARFARWFAEDRGMKCGACGGRLASRKQYYCSEKCEEQHVQDYAI